VISRQVFVFGHILGQSNVKKKIQGKKIVLVVLAVFEIALRKIMD
jgi:hypothetical protein